MTWHVEPRMLEAYAHETIDQVHAYSVEAHLVSCEMCRNQIAGFVDRTRLDHVWTEIVDVVALPKPGPIERSLLKIGVEQHVARLLAATPSLRLSWLTAIALTLSFAVIASYQIENGFLLFLIVAPLIPLAGIAVAYGPGVDPTYEIGLASPTRGFYVLSIRATAVLITTTVPAVVAALALPQPSWAVVAWLLPSLGLTTTSLALTTRFRPLRSASLVAGAWVAGSALAMIYATQSSATVEDVFGGWMQIALLLLTLGSVILLYEGRESFERGVR